ncbi:MAG TPA: hypothetical protein VGF30_12625 [Bacteroidia bacterium]
MGHDTHHHNEGKKAVFGPPVIMGLSFWLFAFFFLSLCDGKKHDAAGHGGEHGAAATEQVEVKKSEENAVKANEDAKTSETDAKKSEETVKTTEEAHH